MKKSILTTFAIFTIGFISKAQTTWDEFNYCTKGFKTQIESGLDLTKKGYTIINLGEQKYTYDGFDNSSVVKLFGLMPIGADKSKALILMYEKYIEKELYTRYYFCIPTEDAPEDMLVQTYQTINSIAFNDEKQTDTTTRLMIIMMKYASLFKTSN